MKLFLVQDESRFFLHDALADFLRQTKDEVLGCALVTEIPKKNSLEHYLMKNFFVLTPVEIMKLVIQNTVYTLKDTLLPKKEKVDSTQLNPF